MSEGIRTSSSIYLNIRRRNKRSGPPWPSPTSITSNIERTEPMPETAPDCIKTESTSSTTSRRTSRQILGTQELRRSPSPPAVQKPPPTLWETVDLGLASIKVKKAPTNRRSRGMFMAKRRQLYTTEGSSMQKDDTESSAARRRNSFEFVMEHVQRLADESELAHLTHSAESDSEYAVEI